MIKVTKLSEKQQREKQERQEEQQRVTLETNLSNAIIDIVETADPEYLIMLAEHIIKKCNHPECSGCTFLKETIKYLKASLEA